MPSDTATDKRFPDGVYSGEVKGNKRDGHGTLVLSFGGEYVGEWRNDKKHGKGRMTGLGRTYDGEWVNDQQEGYGITVWKNGRRYEGEWKGDEINGVGRWRWNDGRVYHGKFKADCPLAGLLLDKDGSVFKVSYSGAHDIADDSLAPVRFEKASPDVAEPFKKATDAWDSKVQANGTLPGLETEAAGIATTVAAAKKATSEAEKEREKSALEHDAATQQSAAADKEAAEAVRKAEEAEKNAGKLRETANKLGKAAGAKKKAAGAAGDAADKAGKAAAAAAKAEADAVKKRAALEAEISKLRKILDDAAELEKNCEYSIAVEEQFAEPGAPAQPALSAAPPVRAANNPWGKPR